ncbi:hypothetical protein C3L33_04205, partial [Rhododendron williamsianum]
MGKRRARSFDLNEALEFLNHLFVDKSLLPFIIPLILVGWVIEKWVFTFSNWVPLVVAVWATIQYGSHQRRILAEDLNRKWKQVILHTAPVTPLEHCEWLNKLLMDIWPNYINPKLCLRFSSIVELLMMPVLDGKAILYSFLSTPEVRIGVAFGSGGSQSLPATELPGVSSWLVKLSTDTLVKTMVEPRRRCLSLPSVDLRKKAVGGIIYVTVISASKLSKSNLKGSLSKRQHTSTVDGRLEECRDNKDMLTFVEVELGELTRKTKAHSDQALNGTQRSIWFYTKIQAFCVSIFMSVKYVADDSTMFWAIGPDSSVIAKHANEVEMVVPFEGANSGNGSTSGSINGWIELVLIEARDLVAADIRGTSDPYVRIHYGNRKRRTKMKEMMVKFQSLIEEGNIDVLSTSLSELESLHDMQDEYIVQLETEQMLLLGKINELGQEIFNASPSHPQQRIFTLMEISTSVSILLQM